MRVLAPLLLLILAACPPVESSAVSETCAQLGAKCKTPKGPLGVCDSRPCAAGETGPCFICMPQH
jgi:hypothetical protein